MSRCSRLPVVASWTTGLTSRARGSRTLELLKKARFVPIAASRAPGPDKKQIIDWDLRLAVHFLRPRLVHARGGAYRWVGSHLQLIANVEEAYEDRSARRCPGGCQDHGGCIPGAGPIVSIGFTCGAAEQGARKGSLLLEATAQEYRSACYWARPASLASPLASWQQSA